MKFCIIGAGIIGSSIAREIRKRDLGDVLVLEKESFLGKHASGRNSGVLHSGINHLPETLKARMCVEGNRKAREFCRYYNVPMDECGTLVVARNDNEDEIIKRLFEMGRELDVHGLEIIEEKELKKREPAIKARRALFSPTGAIVDSLSFLEAVAKESRSLGAEYFFDTKVFRIDKNKLYSTNGIFEAEHVVNCAGLYADKISHMLGFGCDYSILPFRGEYMQVSVPINSMVYQAPNLKFPFLGVHFTKTLDGKVLAGPNSMFSFGRESYGKEINFRESTEMLFSSKFLRMLASRDFLNLAFSNAKTSLSKKAYLNEINSLLETSITETDIFPYRSGIRAQLVDNQGKMINDLIVYSCREHTNVLNAVSPGMTCSLAFAEYVVDRIEGVVS